MTNSWVINHAFDAEDINKPGRHQDTPLILACRRGKKEIALELIGAGANINHRNMDGTDALWACVVSDSFEIAGELLKAGANIDNQNDNGATALMYACSSGKIEWVKYFLTRGANTGLRTLDDFSALDLASNIECLRLLKAATRSA